MNVIITAELIVAVAAISAISGFFAFYICKSLIEKHKLKRNNGVFLRW